MGIVRSYYTHITRVENPRVRGSNPRPGIPLRKSQRIWFPLGDVTLRDFVFIARLQPGRTLDSLRILNRIPPLILKMLSWVKTDTHYATMISWKRVER